MFWMFYPRVNSFSKLLLDIVWDVYGLLLLAELVQRAPVQILVLHVCSYVRPSLCFV